jgi:hypothetical protein
MHRYAAFRRCLHDRGPLGEKIAYDDALTLRSVRVGSLLKITMTPGPIFVRGARGQGVSWTLLIFEVGEGWAAVAASPWGRRGEAA